MAVKSDVAKSETLNSGPVHFRMDAGYFISTNTELDQMTQPPRCGTIYSTKPITYCINCMFSSRFSNKTETLFKSDDFIKMKKKLAHKLSVYLRLKTAMIFFSLPVMLNANLLNVWMGPIRFRYDLSFLNPNESDIETRTARRGAIGLHWLAARS